MCDTAALQFALFVCNKPALFAISEECYYKVKALFHFTVTEVAIMIDSLGYSILLLKINLQS